VIFSKKRKYKHRIKMFIWLLKADYENIGPLSMSRRIIRDVVNRGEISGVVVFFLPS
jgi:hypothetical protein